MIKQFLYLESLTVLESAECISEIGRVKVKIFKLSRVTSYMSMISARQSIL